MGPDPHLIYRRHLGNLHALPDGFAVLVDPEGATVVCSDETARFPRLSELPDWVRGQLAQAGPGDARGGARRAEEVIHQIATWNGSPVYALPLPTGLGEEGGADPPDPAGTGPGPRLTSGSFRTLFGVLTETHLAFLGRAMQIIHWANTSKYCSRCGAPTQLPEEECVARCPECNHVQYPRHAPAMIVGVVRDGRLLLAQSPRFKGAFHSILAGFVEPGESVEECIHREVYEEAGILVKNVRYFGSQSWPFPHSLMLGFTAEWAGGEISLDLEELIHADWYAPDNLPQVPSEVSISGRIIRWFRETHGA